MNLKNLKVLFRQKLRGLYNEAEADHLFFIFLKEITGIPVATYLSQQQMEIAEEGYKKLVDALEELMAGRPYQHILGFTHFLDLELKVSAAALVPRPETEELAQLIRNEAPRDAQMRIVDIGTGTGCLALACAKYFAHAEVLAMDISQEALELARKNALANSLEIKFLKADFLQTDQQPSGKWDLIISNPPYIAEWESLSMDDVVLKNDPRLALFVSDDDPLIFYRKICEFAKRQLSPQGRVYVEINERLGPDTLFIFTSAGFRAQLLKDMSGKDRFVCASLLENPE